ncbi:helix-turn-helix domain-containing protein [Fusicatenibacter sp.]|uniref:response regulator transcription factor n=1 Tax=Fusicatenibacter sp. TaxID=2773922 RepID=UPI00399B5DD6
MYQVLFAEDELLVRLGLQNSIDWKAYDMELAAQADNGLQAYELFQKVRPDVVITDIRMEGMDGCELIEKIRQQDKECAIIVISCLDDFEILRRMIPYKIIGYILKASMTMDEVNEVLKKSTEYLKKIGREGKKIDPEKRSPEKELEKYLLGGSQKTGIPDQKKIENLLVFSLKEEDQEKINGLAMEFVYDLVRRQLNKALIVKTGEKEFCVFSEKMQKNPEDMISRVNHSVEEFLGVRFRVQKGMRKEGEDPKEFYLRVKEKQPGAGENGSYDQIIMDAFGYMQEHYQESLSLTDISSVLGISSSYFSHLFKKQTGKNYVEYLNEIRLKAVMEDLKNSDFKIAVIAEKNGFHNFEYFSRFFKKATGLSPVKWRQENR